MEVEENTMGRYGPGSRLVVPAREMDAYRYADGRPMERGHMVYVPEEGTCRTYLIAGWARESGVVLRPLLGGPPRRVEASAVSRSMPDA